MATSRHILKIFISAIFTTIMAFSSSISASAAATPKVARSSGKVKSAVSKASTGKGWTPSQQKMTRVQAMEQLGKLELRKRNDNYGIALKGSSEWIIPPVFHFSSSTPIYPKLGVMQYLFFNDGKENGAILINPRGMRLLPHKAHTIKSYESYNLFLFSENNSSFYFVDYSGKIVSPEFTEYQWKENLIWGRAGYHTKIYDTAFRPLAELNSSKPALGKLYNLEEGRVEWCYFIDEELGKKNIVNVDGTPVFKPKYRDLDMQAATDIISSLPQFQSENLRPEILSWFLVATDYKNQRYGLIDVLGKTIIDCKSTSLENLKLEISNKYSKKIHTALTTERPKMEEKMEEKFWRPFRRLEYHNKEGIKGRPSAFTDEQLTTPLPVVRNTPLGYTMFSGERQIGNEYKKITQYGYGYVAETKNGKNVMLNVFGEECSLVKYDKIELWTPSDAGNNIFLAQCDGEYILLKENGAYVDGKSLGEKEMYAREAAKGHAKARTRLAAIKTAEVEKSRLAALQAKKEKLAAEAKARKEKAAALTQARREKAEAAARAKREKAEIAERIKRGKVSAASQSGSSLVASAGNRRSSSGHTVSRRQSVPQAPRYEAKTWRQDLPYGGFVITNQSENGIQTRTTYGSCVSCHGTRRCSNCYGSGVCQMCNGRGGMITGGYGNFIPCYACQSTGRCNICGGGGGCICNRYDFPGFTPISCTTIFPDGQSISNSYLTGGSSTSHNSGSERSSDGLSESYYRENYDRWASTAESIYNSFTNTGVDIEYRSGKREGYVDKSNGPYYTGMQQELRSAQREMRKIREEASRKGYHIPVSRWETATVR